MKLFDAAAVLRSKNSGPFEITVDVLFDDPSVYYKIKEQGLINKELVSRLYNIEQHNITQIVFFDQALGFKITFARKVSSGTFLDRDVYGAQQHAPLMELEINL
ncbi:MULTISPECIES: DUF4387 domain-containing protein [Paenibacillus]|uniref:DUF4387 domain-containing protein n=1 Tax=Paenibacillus oleatilyticus TaxID=2594886 RepID=A0ABV4V0D1_9BACL|nr:MULTISPECIES: DUF4387 domain-containing protein [Paenibacillus]KPV60976.1 acyl-CoA synthetase [Paenibacillus sp. A3]MBU7315342.1 DUF4387 domain-containing protein [Paenibacillus oleatilyticus]MCM3269047.1 DUF4387 domain-containing protein [Paenibacillus elgii]MCP1308162.1 DUF4387 domain-containing protein [Paenibacillus tyrfis]GLI06755.1 acyl-CoA synthetase [Paenibacillus tyrfis]